MIDEYRGTGRTTAMLKQAVEYQKENPYETVAILCVNQSQSSNSKLLFVKLGGDYRKVVWINYTGGEPIRSYDFRGFGNDQIFIDHYVYDRYYESESIKRLGR